MAGSKVGVALGAIVVLAGIGGGAVWWQAMSQSEAEVQRLLDSAGSALKREPVDRDEARAVARQIGQLRSRDEERLDLLLAQCELLMAADDANGAWDLAKGPVSLPGADPQLQDVAGRVLERVAARSGDPASFRQAATLSASYAQSADDAPALLRAFLLAFRAGDAELMADYGAGLVESYPSSSEASAVKALGGDLAGWVADRSGLALQELDADAGGAGGALAELRELAGRPGSASEVDGLRIQLGEATPEILLVLAARAAESVGEARDGAAEEAIFNALDRVQEVLEMQPSSLEARHIAAVLHLGVWQVRNKLETEDRARLRGYLDWLLRNAPEEHARRAAWQQMRAAIPE